MYYVSNSSMIHNSLTKKKKKEFSKWLASRITLTEQTGGNKLWGQCSTWTVYRTQMQQNYLVIHVQNAADQLLPVFHGVSHLEDEEVLREEGIII